MNATKTNERDGEIKTVGDIAIRRKCLAFSPDQYVRIILPTMQFSRVGAAGVVDEKGELVGVISERDILRQIFKLMASPVIAPANAVKHVDDMTVRDAMINNPKCLDEDMDIETALAVMTEFGYRFMPVISRDDPRKLLGIVDEREIAIHVKNRLDNIKREAEAKESVLQYLFHEPYGVGFDPKNL